MPFLKIIMNPFGHTSDGGRILSHGLLSVVWDAFSTNVSLIRGSLLTIASVDLSPLWPKKTSADHTKQCTQCSLISDTGSGPYTIQLLEEQ